MKLRTALPILIVAGLIMMIGWESALAEETPPPVPTRRPRVFQPRNKHPPAKTPPGKVEEEPPLPSVQLPPLPAAPAPAPVTAPAQPGAGQPAQSTLPPFETGIDYRPVSPRKLVTFNLEDADLPDLVRLIANMTGRRFILPSKARSIKASVFAPTQVTLGEAYQAFLSILEINGMSVVPVGRYLKIVDSAGIEGQPIGTFGDDAASPSDDRYVTRMHRVKHISSDDALQLLNNFKSRDGKMTAYAPTNTLIITDLGSNLRRMLHVLEAIDVPRSGEQIWIEPIHYASAPEIAGRLKEIFPTGSDPNRAPPQPGQAPTSAGKPGDTRIGNILADERTNSLIILATESAYLRLLEVIKQLDVALEGEGRIHVHYLQHSDAEKVSSTLQNLIGGQGGGGGRQPGQQGQGGGGSEVFEGQIRLTAHADSNALVITSSLHDYASLKRVIERLDAARKQVFIEAVIMELSISRTHQFGLSYHGGIAGIPSDGSLSVLGFDAQKTANPQVFAQEALSGLALGIRGPNIPEAQQTIGFSVPAFGVVVKALATTGDANILATPHILARDNVQAEINVGENIALQTSGIPAGALSTLGGLGGLGGQPGATTPNLGALAGLGAYGSPQRQDVGTKIRITPHINDTDEIRLEIDEEISQRGATEGTLGVVSIDRRTAKTEVVVRDQQTVVIGGLIRDEVATSETKIPVLGDIPLLGVLFRQTKKVNTKRNLLLFLTPYIIRDQSDLRAIYERKMRERQEFLDRYFVFTDQDYSPPLDYSRTRGIVGEIINEIRTNEEEARILIEAQRKPAPQHNARPAIGSDIEGSSTPPQGDHNVSSSPPSGESGSGESSQQQEYTAP